MVHGLDVRRDKDGMLLENLEREKKAQIPNIVQKFISDHLVKTVS